MKWPKIMSVVFSQVVQMQKVTQNKDIYSQGEVGKVGGGGLK